MLAFSFSNSWHSHRQHCDVGTAYAELGDGDLKVLDKKTLQRLEDIAKLNSDDKIHIFYALDNLIKAAKLKAI